MLPRRRLFSSVFLPLSSYLSLESACLQCTTLTPILIPQFYYCFHTSWKVQCPIPTGYDDASRQRLCADAHLVAHKTLPRFVPPLCLLSLPSFLHSFIPTYLPSFILDALAALASPFVRSLARSSFRSFLRLTARDRVYRRAKPACVCICVFRLVELGSFYS